MQLKEIEALMREKPYLLNMGAGKLAKGFKVTQDVIKLAKSNVSPKNGEAFKEFG